jgi:hypothetical protein
MSYAEIRVANEEDLLKADIQTIIDCYFHLARETTLGFRKAYNLKGQVYMKTA